MKNIDTPSIQDEINDTTMNAPHVVILGAGASRQAFPKGDKNGNLLPVMRDFIKIVGLQSILKRYNIHFSNKENFEELYSRISNDPRYIEGAQEIEQTIRNYFSQLELPDCPTLYDHLVLSLRGKDVIATFNWDPFLYAAWNRNYHVGDMPHVLFLHGAVNIGYCKNDRQMGFITNSCEVCHEHYHPTPLLYPITKKKYQDEFIEPGWWTLQKSLEHAHVLTIFGYGAPESDVEAIKLLKEGWGKPGDRNLEQIEIINTLPEEELRETWYDFIHTHHYDVIEDFYDSWIARHPRRTCDAMWSRNMMNRPYEDHNVPRNLGFKELWDWYKPLIQVERAKKH